MLLMLDIIWVPALLFVKSVPPAELLELLPPMPELPEFALVLVPKALLP
jgi:hypothetical protein